MYRRLVIVTALAVVSTTAIASRNDLAEYNGEGRYVLPVPATFVIDQDGIIRATFADVDYRQRVEPAEIVAMW